MCGTPFPHRSLTVPSAQSTLSFTSAPIEVAAVGPSRQPAAEKKNVATVAEPEAALSSAAAVEPEPFEFRSRMKDVAEPEIAPEDVRAHDAPVVTEAGTLPGTAEDVAPERLTEAAADEVETPPEEPAVFLSSDQPAHLTEAGTLPLAESAAQPAQMLPQPEAPRVTEAELLSQLEEAPPPPHELDWPAEPPVHEPELPPEPAPRESEWQEPPIREPELEPEVPVEAKPTPNRREIVSKPRPPEPPRVEERPVTVEAPHVEIVPPIPMEIPRPAPRVVPRPETRVAPSVKSTRQKPAAIHRSPDSLPITPPPPSAGMPTFQEVADAAGAPPLSPFEQLAQKPAGEDEDLKQFVENFRYTPPDEAAAELTMRSEAPVIDKAAPAQFHHASFDEDVPPPPEVGPHPTGAEFYAPEGTTSGRSRFLDIEEEPKKPTQRVPADGGKSLLGIKHAAPAVPTARVVPPRSRGRARLWTSLLALLAIFGVLGYLKGRSEGTQAVRGPADWARDTYDLLREYSARSTDWARNEYQRLQDKFAKKDESAPATTTENTPPAPPANSRANTAAQSPNSQPGAQPSNPALDTSSLASTASTTPSSSSQSQAPAGSSVAAITAPTEPPKRLEPPVMKPSSKPQPGQQELIKALNASDASAAAAWLWKSTSRGNPEAPVRLADMYIKGNGVPRSCEQALVLLRSAATKENAPARNRLAALYANGTCVTRDRVRAYEFLTSALAADPNSDWARESRELLWDQMTPSERTLAQKYR